MENQECGKEGATQARLDRMGEQGPPGADRGTRVTYSQRTSKDVNIALYINLTASPPPHRERAGEKKGQEFRGLC